MHHRRRIRRGIRQPLGLDTASELDLIFSTLSSTSLQQQQTSGQLGDEQLVVDEDGAHCRLRAKTRRDRVPRECTVCRRTRCNNDDRA